VGNDVDEFVELAYPTATVDITTYSLALYDGSGRFRRTHSLSTATTQSTSGSISFATIDFFERLEEDSEGIALLDASSNVVDFISYDAQITAMEGPANGATSLLIGVSENIETPATHSLQLIGSGCYAKDFTWTGPLTNSKGTVNSGQTISC